MSSARVRTEVESAQTVLPASVTVTPMVPSLIPPDTEPFP